MNISNNNLTIRISGRTIATILLIIVLIAALMRLTDLVLVVLTSIVIASFVRTVSSKLKQYHIPKTLSVIVLYCLGFIILSSLFYFFIPVLIVEFAKIIPLIATYIPGVFSDGALAGAKDAAFLLEDSSGVSSVIAQLQTALVSLGGGFLSAISSLFGNIANVILIIVISFYLSLAEDGIESFLKMVTPKKHELYVIDLWHRSQRKIAYWLRGQMIMGLIIGLLTFIALSIIGIEYALLLSVIAVVLELVPFGMILAAIPAISLALASGGVSLALLVTLIYFGLQQIEAYVLQPLVIRRVTGVSPIAVILSVLIGFQLAGFWGLVLAIPVAVTLLEYIKDREKNKVSLDT